MEPTYVVSSFHRSGSSMMMRCLEAGGIPAVFDPLFDTLWNTVYGSSDYTPNHNGFYQSDDTRTDWPSFHLDTAGKVIKVPRWDLHLLPPGRYKVLFMVRDPREIIASMRKFSPFVHWGQMEVNVYLYDLLKQATLDRIAHQRTDDYQVLEVYYPDVVQSPIAEFTKIRGFGVPIDVARASGMVQPELHRLRLESL